MNTRPDGKPPRAKRLLRDRQGIHSSTLPQTLLLILACFGTLTAFTVYSSQPEWWVTRGAVLPPVVTTNGDIVSTNYLTNDYAVVTQGQLKQFTTRAMEELDSSLTNSGGAGTGLANLVAGWREDYATHGYNASNLNPSDYQAMTVGQVKYVASLVYGRLATAGYPQMSPSWLHVNTSSDNAVANLGQLKQVFNFDLSLPGPSQVSATAGSGSVTLNWTFPSTDHVTGLLIQQQNTDGTWTTLDTLTELGTTSYTVSGLTDGQNYAFQLIAAGGSTSASQPTGVSCTPGGTPSIVFSGADQTWVTKSDGTLAAWGRNHFGQLGTEGGADVTSPTSVSGATQPTAVATGSSHTLVLQHDGTVLASGDNYFGQLGDGTTNDHATPAAISALSGVKAIGVGDGFSVALKADGTIYTWGTNAHGQLGQGDQADRLTPTVVDSLSGITAIAVGRDFVLALTATGTVVAWGDNHWGQIGDGSTSTRSTPVTLSSFASITAIAAGTHHALAVDSGGHLWSWGENAFGQGGDNTLASHPTPYQVSGVTTAKTVAAGFNHSLVATTASTLLTFGANDAGQLGDGTLVDQTTPVLVAGVSPTGVAAGTDHSAAMTANGTLFLFGANAHGQLGSGTTTSTPTPTATTY